MHAGQTGLVLQDLESCQHPTPSVHADLSHHGGLFGRPHPRRTLLLCPRKMLAPAVASTSIFRPERQDLSFDSRSGVKTHDRDEVSARELIAKQWTYLSTISG